MKILYDYQTFTEQNYGGISRYFAEILNLLKKDENIEFKISSLCSNNYYLNKYGLNRSKFLPSLDFKGKRRIMKIINQTYARHLLKKNDFDLFHPTYYNTYFLKLLKDKPYVLTVHDLIYEIYDNGYISNKVIRSFIRESISNATHIISISENTKKNIIEYYGIDSDKITTIYHGNSLFVNESNKCCSKTPKDYFLFVGTRTGYKNFSNLVISIAEILKKNNISLVCAGGNIPHQEEKRLLREFKIENSVIFYPLLKDEELAHLYKNALAFIFPSQYEGFGIPVLEAFACGCPVLLSNSSSFPEVAGNAALYFDPYSHDSMLNSVKKIIQSKTLRENLIQKGSERIKLFTWESAYLKTIEVYKKLM